MNPIGWRCPKSDQTCPKRVQTIRGRWGHPANAAIGVGRNWAVGMPARGADDNSGTSSEHEHDFELCNGGSEGQKDNPHDTEQQIYP